MRKRAEGGEVGSRERKRKENDEMKGKGRAAHYKVGPRAASCAARDHHARVPSLAPKRHFKPRATFSHPVRSSSTPGMSIWTPKGLARELRRTARQP